MKKQRGLTYKDFGDKERVLADRRVRALLATFPDDIRTKITQAFLANDHEGQDARDVLAYFLQSSAITNAVVKNPGGAKAFEYLYKKEAHSPIDQYFLDCDAGHYIYRRLKTMERVLPPFLRTAFADQERITVDNIGSGQGYDFIAILLQNPDLRARVHVRNIDPDADALRVGWEDIVRYGLEDNFECIVDKIGTYPGRNADFLHASGIFCPVPVPICKRMVKNTFAQYVRPGGYMLYNATTVKMIQGLQGDQFTDFTMRFMNWNMGFKTEKEILSICARSPLWTIVTYFFDTDRRGHDVGYNMMVIAQKK